jgi:hypothetical protein
MNDGHLPSMRRLFTAVNTTEKKVVLTKRQNQSSERNEYTIDTDVPINIHNVWLIRNQVMKAEMSSTPNLLKDRIANHLNLIRERAQNPSATFRKSSRVGRRTVSGRALASCL